MTRDIRFNCYKSIYPDDDIKPIFLGHIREDKIENIWTNFANGRELFNLSKMNKIGLYEKDITICRVFLDVDKSELLSISESEQIPYLKNTTPTWSSRGKYREHFRPELINQ
mmetsp:Transcript_35706/g.30018  ORF Transcript_35706/g.30018 Transcript_35706/m.30018 type:complete len:112 (+) Transcript_35706:368-703(+)